MFGNNITAKELKEKLEKGLTDKEILIDIREGYEWEGGHIEGAVHIPMGEIGSKLEELKKYNQVYIYCASGNRTGMLTMQMNNLGINTKDLQGGLMMSSGQGLKMVN